MKYKNKQRLFLIATLLITACTNLSAQRVLPSWAFGPFIRPPHVNPVLSPDARNLFNDPMTGKKVAWESNDVFNPAAAIKGKKIYVIYRAEDKSGVGIGERTSRLGLA